MVFMSIISIVVVSFAFLMRREQQQALDRQLSTQAFYAAESAVSEAVSKIQQGTLNNDVTDCADSGGISGDLQGDSSASISCVLVDRSPSTLEFTEIGTQDSKIIRIEAANGQEIRHLDISWQAVDEASAALFATNSVLRLPTEEFQDAYPDTFANHTGILRADIMPITDEGSINRGTLSGRARALFFYPAGVDYMGSFTNTVDLSADPVTNFPETGDGAFVLGACDAAVTTPYHCNVNVNNVGAQFGDNTAPVVYLRLKSIYQPTTVSISAFNNANQQVDLIGSQIVVDATGQSNGVLRRIQVRVPSEEAYEVPEFSLETVDDICKLLQAAPGAILNDDCL